MTDAEKVTKLAAAIGRADRFLAEIDAVAEINSIARGAGNRKCSELTQGAVRRARKTLQRALRCVEDKTNRANKPNQTEAKL